MLNQQQAAQIVLDCIRATSGVDQVALAGTLGDASISDLTLLGLISRIVNDSDFGVPSAHHQIDVGWFQNIDTDSRCLEVVDIVRTQSTPTPV
jgi:hypothetical protein